MNNILVIVLPSFYIVTNPILRGILAEFSRKDTERGERKALCFFSLGRFIYKPDGLHEKSLLMGLMVDAYHVQITRACPCNVSPLTEAKDLDLRQYEDFIGEGTSVLLMRYLAMVNHVGVLRFHNVTMDGGVATNDYVN